MMRMILKALGCGSANQAKISPQEISLSFTGATMPLNVESNDSSNRIFIRPKSDLYLSMLTKCSFDNLLAANSSKSQSQVSASEHDFHKKHAVNENAVYEFDSSGGTPRDNKYHSPRGARR